jgi:hypothetical protein
VAVEVQDMVEVVVREDTELRYLELLLEVEPQQSLP